MCPIEAYLGISRDTFLSEHFSRRPLTGAIGGGTDYQALPTLSDFLQSIALPSLDVGAVKVYRSGELLATPTLRAGNLDLQSLWETFEGGASIVLNSLHRIDPRVAALSRDLTLSLGHRVQANGYLSPPRSAAFATHFDSHDVIVVQTSGTKEWDVFGPPSDSSNLEAKIERRFVLSPGETLYLPRGWPHRTCATDKVSFHITFGLTPVTWAEFLKTVVDICSAGNARLSSPISVDLFRDDMAPAEPLVMLAEAISLNAQSDPTAQAFDAIRKSVIGDLRIPVTPLLASHFPTAVAWRTAAYYRISQVAGRFLISNGVKSMEITELEAAIVGRFATAGHLDQDDAELEGSRHLIQRLATLGLVDVPIPAELGSARTTRLD